jgi:hypothetical protein
MVESPAAVDDMLRASEAAELAWAVHAESEYRAVLRVASETSNPLQQARVWWAVGAYLWRRAQNQPAVLAFEAARIYSRKAGHAEAEELAVTGMLRSLRELGDETGALAALMLLGKLQEAELRDLPRRTKRRLRQPQMALNASIQRSARLIPDFERRFLAGELQFDRAEALLEVFQRRARHRAASLQTQAWNSEQQAYRRQLRSRVVWPALLLMAIVAALTIERPYLPRWASRAVLLPLALIYVSLWAASLRASWRWVSFHRKVGPDLGFLERMIGDSSTHDEAVTTLERFVARREPFLLYLRSFEGEASESLTPEGAILSSARQETFVENALREGTAVGGYIEPTRFVTGHQSGPSRFERYLADHVLKVIPVVTIANPAAVGGSHLVPRLEVENDVWPSAVRLLVSAAHCIVVEPARASGGVGQELQLIMDLDRHADSIVVLPSGQTRSREESTRQLTRLGYDQPVGPTTAFTTIEDEVLSGFPRVVDDEAFGDRDPRTLRVFRDILPPDDPVTPEAYGERRRERTSLRHRAVLLHREGLARLDGGEPAAATELLQQAADLFGNIGDLADQAMPMTYQGRARQALGDLDRAEACFAAAAAIQCDTGPPEDCIGSLHHLGLVQLEKRVLGSAQASFEQMLELSRRWHYGRGEARAFEGLALCAYAAGDRQAAVRKLEAAVAACVDPRDRASLEQVLEAVRAPS